jgi:lysophospholipase L1-like esterase
MLKKEIILIGIIVIEVLFLIYLLKSFYSSYSIIGGFVYFTPQKKLKMNELNTQLPTYDVNVFRDSDNKILLLELIPNHTELFDGVSVKLNRTTKVRINSDGLRDFEHTIYKPENVTRILIIGDSNEYGLGVELEEAYPKVLEKIINERCKGRYEVISAAVPGYDLRQKIELLRVKGIKYSPDIVILGIGFDDLTNSSYIREILEREYKKLRELNLSREEYKMLSIQKMEEINRIELEKVVSLDKLELKRRLEELFKEFKNVITNTTIKKVVIFERIATTANLDKALQEIADNNGWYFVRSNIPCENETFFSNSPENILHPLDPHPSIVGHQKLASLLFCNIKKILD